MVRLKTIQLADRAMGCKRRHLIIDEKASEGADLVTSFQASKIVGFYDACVCHSCPELVG
jgi:hypothetical protein